MARSEQIRVMISSRCKTRISFQKKQVWLSDLREKLTSEIESVRLWDDQPQLFDCWINEESTGSAADETWWERSVNESKDADILLVLYNGESGGAIKDGPMGICQAELDNAMTNSRKVRVIPIVPLADLPKNKAQRARDEAFRAYVDNLSMFAPEVNSGEELLNRVRHELRDLVVGLVQNAATTPDLSKSNIGPALEWHRMSYVMRESAMRTTLETVLAEAGSETGSATGGEWTTMWITLAGKKILAALHAVPAALSQPAAREIVGQPFLMDHTLHSQLGKGDGGPVHIVACYKSVTESQALKMLGFPDATVVPGRFGLHVADSVQKIQIVLLKNCQSPAGTRDALNNWLQWVKRTAEDQLVAARAADRKRIIDAIAKVNRK